MKLARIFLLAALSIAAFAQELPKNLDIVYFNYDNELLINSGLPGVRTIGIWVAVFIPDPDVYAVEVRMEYKDTKGIRRSADQIVRRPYPSQVCWASVYFPLGKVTVRSITATALKVAETNSTIVPEQPWS